MDRITNIHTLDSNFKFPSSLKLASIVFSSLLLSGCFSSSPDNKEHFSQEVLESCASFSDKVASLEKAHPGISVESLGTFESSTIDSSRVCVIDYTSYIGEVTLSK